MLTLRKFLDAGYAILVEEYQRLGIDLLTAVEKLGSFAAGRPDPGDELQTEAPPPPTQGVVAQNQASMAELQKMMAGVARA